MLGVVEFELKEPYFTFNKIKERTQANFRIVTEN